MKVDLSQVSGEIIDDLVELIKNKEPKAVVKKSGKSLEIEGISSRKVRFYTKKVIGASKLNGTHKVISQGDHFFVYFTEKKD